MEKRAVIRRTLAGAAIATLVSLPFVSSASAGVTDTDTDNPVATTSTIAVATTQRSTTTTAGGSSLARTGGDWAVPATVAGAGVAIAVGARRLSRRPV